MGLSETDGSSRGAAPSTWAGLRARGGRPESVPDRRAHRQSTPDPLAALAGEEEAAATADRAREPQSQTRIKAAVREWLMDLQVLGRSQRTIRWYEQKIHTATAA